MSDLLPEDVAFIRTYVVWTPPTDDDLQARYLQLYTEQIQSPQFTGPFDPYALRKQIRVVVAESYVRTRLAQMLDEPDSFTTEDYSESWRGNPQYLTAFLKELAAMSSDSGFSVGQLVRGDGGYRDQDDPTFGIDPYRQLHGRRY